MRVRRLRRRRSRASGLPRARRAGRSCAWAPVASVGASPRSSQPSDGGHLPRPRIGADHVDEAHRPVRGMHAQPVGRLVDAADVAAVRRRRGAERVLHHPEVAEHAEVARERVRVGLHQPALDDGLAALVLDDRVAVLRRPVRPAPQRTGEDTPRRAEQRRAHVEVVHHQVDADATGARRVDHPVVPARRRREPLRARGERPPELLRLDDPAELRVLGPEAQHEAHHEQLAGALARRDDGLRVLERECDRLLEQHVLARGEGALRRLAVLRRRQADVDDVHVVALQRRVEVVARLRPAQGRHALGALERARGDGDDARASGLRRPGAGVGLAHEAAAHDRDVDHPRPSAFRCEQARVIDALTSASGGHGSPWNSISTESGPR